MNKIYFSRKAAKAQRNHELQELSTNYPPQADPPISRSGIKKMADTKRNFISYSAIQKFAG